MTGVSEDLEGEAGEDLERGGGGGGVPVDNRVFHDFERR